MLSERILSSAQPFSLNSCFIRVTKYLLVHDLKESTRCGRTVACNIDESQRRRKIRMTKVMTFGGNGNRPNRFKALLQARSIGSPSWGSSKPPHTRLPCPDVLPLCELRCPLLLPLMHSTAPLAALWHGHRHLRHGWPTTCTTRTTTPRSWPQRPGRSCAYTVKNRT